MSSRAAETPKPRRPSLAIAWLALSGVALALGWWFLSRSGAQAQRSLERSAREANEVAIPQPSVARAPRAKALPLPATAVTASSTSVPATLKVATDGLPYMPAAADAPATTGPVHPHPITAEHARIFRENATIQALNDAMDSQDARTLRGFLARYRSEYPEDAQQLQQGYELIADCLERRPGYRAAAQRYFDEENGSSLRRFVARHCLGGP